MLCQVGIYATSSYHNLSVVQSPCIFKSFIIIILITIAQAHK